MFDQIEIDELAERITARRKAYYAGSPVASDAEYDADEARLKELAPNHELLQEVGADMEVSSFEKFEHQTLMLSLDKAYTVDAVLNWAPIEVGISMPKMDGFANALHYVRVGDVFRLTVGATRGKGQKGEDVTANLKQVKDIPHQIPGNLLPVNVMKFEVRGEVYMKRSTFLRLGLDKEYENCRNIAPGSVRQKDPKVTRERELNFFAYNIIGIDAPSMSTRLTFLANIGFPVVPHCLVNLRDRSVIQGVFDSMNQMREVNDYDMDGVVFCVDSIAEIERLGNTSHHPRAFIALKFEAEEAETTLNEIQMQVSRTAQINPVGIFNPVRLEGANITNATLHNISEMIRLGIGIGDRIIVSRRGGVIPKIERVVKSVGNLWEIPRNCPVCGGVTELRTNIAFNGEKIQVLFCTNIDCPAVSLTKIVHFVKVMEIDDVAEGMITKLVDAGHVNTVIDLYKVTREQLLKLPSVKDRTADRYLENVNLSRSRPLNQFLQSLGIHTLGESVSKSLADVFGTLEKVLAATASDLSGISGIGDEIARSVTQGLKNNAELISLLAKEIKVVERKKVNTSGLPLAGKSFLITGTLTKPRKEFEEKLIEANGGIVSSSVSKSLSYLIVGDAPGGKLGKAKSAGVKIITEIEFMELLK